MVEKNTRNTIVFGVSQFGTFIYPFLTQKGEGCNQTQRLPPDAKGVHTQLKDQPGPLLGFCFESALWGLQQVPALDGMRGCSWESGEVFFSAQFGVGIALPQQKSTSVAPFWPWHSWGNSRVELACSTLPKKCIWRLNIAEEAAFSALLPRKLPFPADQRDHSSKTKKEHGYLQVTKGHHRTTLQKPKGTRLVTCTSSNTVST